MSIVAIILSSISFTISVKFRGNAKIEFEFNFKGDDFMKLISLAFTGVYTGVCGVVSVSL